MVLGTAIATARNDAASGCRRSTRISGWRSAMGLFDAMTTSVSGLQAQSYAMQNISGNIANAQTTAYKDIGTSFENLVPDNIPSQQIAGGVIASSSAHNTVQGAIQSAAVGTDMAINGDGFFVVQKAVSFSANTPIFNGVNLYTRRGDFQKNAQGFMVNGAGYYLVGIPINPTTGNPVGSVPIPLQFQNNFLPASPTTNFQYGLNLPTYPKTASAVSTTPGSELLTPANFSVNPAFTSRVVGNVSNLTTASSFPVVAGRTITVGDGTGTATVTSGGAVTVQNILTAVNSAGLNVRAFLNSNGQIQLESSGAHSIL